VIWKGDILVTGQVLAVNVSGKRGEIKHNINEAFIKENYGLETDAHSGDWHRQVSLLSLSSFDKMRKMGAIGLDYGVFAENITVGGLDVATLPLQSKIKVGEAILEVTQIGKECHNQGCAIKKQVGSCVMPIEGIFTRVLSSGWVKVGDQVEVLERGK
jgi:MOSC domain-containing protein YiiM